METAYPQSPPPPMYEEEELTLKDIVTTIVAYWQEVKSSFWIPVLVGAIVGGVALVWWWMSTTTFTAAKTFLVTEETIDPKALEFSPDIESIDYSLEKLATLARSGKIVHQTLFKEVEIDGDRVYLANHVIDAYGFHSAWAESKDLANFYFKSDNILAFNETEYKVLNTLTDRITGNTLTGIKGWMEVGYDKTEIFSLKVTTINSELSLALVEILFQELKDFYTDQTVGRLRQTYQLVQEREGMIDKDLKKAEQHFELELIHSQETAYENAEKHQVMLTELRNLDKEKAILEAEKELAVEELSRKLEVANFEKELAIEELTRKLEVANFEKELAVEEVSRGIKLEETTKVIIELKDLEKLINVEENTKLLEVYSTVLSKETALRNIEKRLNELETEKAIAESSVKKFMKEIEEEREITINKTKRQIKQSEVEKEQTLSNNKRIIDLNQQEKELIITDITEGLDKALIRSEDLASQIANIMIEKAAQKAQNLDDLYTDITKNRQTLEYMLNNKTPEFEVIDQTFIPIKNATVWWMSLLVGSLVGVFLGVGYIIGRKVVKDALV